MRETPEGLVELTEAPLDPRLTNADLAPTRIEQRTWGVYHVASLWIGLSVCIPTYMLAAGLVDGGMSWWQAMLTILLGNLIVLAPMIAIAHAGTRYGIPFPVLARASFGTSGAQVPALTTMVGFWATLALNIPDLSRFARSQRAQALGQLLGLPPTMVLFSFVGVAVTSASVLVFGEAIWDPVALLSRLESPVVVLVSLFAVLVATLTTNVAANVVAPANGFANLWPRRIGFAAGSLLTGVIGIAIRPWQLLADYGTYIFGWLVGYSGFLGPIALVRRGRLSLPDLYSRDGIYGRWNWRALAALAAEVTAALIGLVIPAVRFLYDYAWFVGFGVAFALYALLMGGGRRALAPRS